MNKRKRKKQVNLKRKQENLATVKVSQTEKREQLEKELQRLDQMKLDLIEEQKRRINDELRVMPRY